MGVERDDVRMISHHENAITRYAHATIDSTSSIADQPFGSRPLVMPDFAAAARVERIAFVGTRDVHDAVDHDWCYLQTRCIRETENPLCREPANIVSVDLRKSAVAAARIRTVVARPIGLRCNRAIATVCFPQYADLPVFAEQLQVGLCLVKRYPCKWPPIDRRGKSLRRRSVPWL